MKYISKLLVISITFVALATNVYAVASTPAPLSPAAQEAFDKGIMAAREQGFLVAIRYLQDSRKIAPQAPQIFRSLGAVESKIPGRELRAIAWYGAYLAALPNAPDAAEVKKEIVRLEVKSEINTSALISSVRDAASLVPIGKGAWPYNLSNMAKLWAEVGDTAQALKTASLIGDEVFRCSTLSQIAGAQAKAGDIAGALKTADLIWRADYKSQAQSAIAEVQIYAGDIAGAKKTLVSALKTANLIEGEASSEPQSTIAKAQAEAGDIAGAQKTAGLIQVQHYRSSANLYIATAQANSGDIAGAQKIADRIPIMFYRSMAQMAIAEVQAKNGDIADAQKTVNLIEDGNDASSAQSAIASAQANSGDIAGAQKTADSIPIIYYKGVAHRAIAEVQAKNGDFAGALKTANLIQDTTWKKGAHSFIAATQAKAVIANAAVFEWLKKLDDDNKSNDCPLNTEPFLDLAGYLKSLPSSDVPQKVFDSLYEVARKIVRAQNIIHLMLKKEAKK